MFARWRGVPLWGANARFTFRHMSSLTKFGRWCWGQFNSPPARVSKMVSIGLEPNVPRHFTILCAN